MLGVQKRGKALFAWLVALALGLSLLPSSDSFGAAVYVPSTIQGDAQGDRFGYSLDLNSDGTRLIVGNQTSTADIKVFGWDGAALSQIGQTITITGNYGHVAIDDAGDSIAIGDRSHSDNKGAILVYDLQGSTWTQRGLPMAGVERGTSSDIYHDGFGQALSMSGDGNTVVATGAGTNACSYNGGAYGLVRAFQWDGSAWAQKGSSLAGTSCEHQVWVGRISDDGERFTAFWDNSSESSAETRAYQWDSDASDWTQLGQTFTGGVNYTWGSGTLSDDGETWALRQSTGNLLRLYRLQSGSWVRLGGDIVHTQDDYLDVIGANRLNGDGNTVIFGARNSDPRGKVYVYDWDGSAWTSRFTAMEGSTSAGYVNFGFDVAISEDGRISAASDLHYDTYRGLVRMNAIGPFNLSFDLASGTSSDHAQLTGDFRSTLTIPSSLPTRSGYNFNGWATTSNGSVSYAAGDSFTVPLEDSTLYAIWSQTSSEASNSSSRERPVAAPEESKPEESKPANSAISRPPVAITPVPRQGPVSGPVARAGVIAAPPRQPGLTIGGKPATLEISNATDKRASFVAGTVTLGLKVAGDVGAFSRQAGGSLELQVQNQSSTSLSGAGLMPRAVVQVFLPISEERHIELSQLQVDEEGRFDGEVVFEQAPGESPLPIGPRLLQLVSVDEDGNQIVIEMTVRIEQSRPAPETNLALGSRPQLAPGQSLATSGGMPVAVRVTQGPEAGSVGVEGDGWSMLVGSDAGTGQNQGLELARGKAAAVSGSGFMPGTRADVWLFSDPILLGSFDVDESGNFKAEFGVDIDRASAGQHTLQIQGVGTDGYVRAASLGVSISDGEPSPVVDMAESFQALWWIATIAMVLILAILSFVVVRRRQSE